MSLSMSGLFWPNALRFILIDACISSLLLFIMEVFFVLFTHSPVDGHLCCFQLLAVVWRLLQTFTGRPLLGHVFFRLRQILRSGIAVSYGQCLFKLIRNCQTVFLQWLSPLVCESSSSSTFHQVLSVWSVFNFHPFCKCVMLSGCSFTWLFSNTLMTLNFFAFAY